MPKKATLLSVYQFLPQTNCGECGEITCMTFASKLLERKAAVEECPPLQQPRYKAEALKLRELVAPPIKEVVVGIGERAVKIGGKEVLYRHELTLHNPTAIAIDVSDKMDDSTIVARCRLVEGFQFTRIGEKLTLNALAVRSASGKPERFAQTVALVTKSTNLPLVLCSLDPEALRLAVEQKDVLKRRPLLYAATKDNWKEMGALVRQYNCPLAVFAPNNLKALKSLVRALRTMGVEDMVLDPGFFPEGEKMKESIENLVMIRRAAIQREDKDFGYPILLIPAVAWLGESVDERAAAYKESYLTSLLITRFTDMMILHSTEAWSILPVITLRQSVYTDPRKPVAVEPGLREIGKPDAKAPVLITSNFALTYYTVSNDIEAQGVACHLLVLNTEGLSVETSVAGGQFTAAGVKDLISSTMIEGKVKHRKLMIPGMAARLSGDIEDQAKWEVVVGPRDSSQIKEFIEKQRAVAEG
jgi:acetyl-CoA decarbonylase/synthase complex subunit gamma